VQNVCLRQFPIKCTLMLSILFKVLSSWHPNNNVFHIIFLCNLLYMQFIYAFFFLIKSISLYRKPKCLIYFMQILYVITLLFMDNILKLKILAIHEIVPQYYYRIYTVLHVLTILNVHTQYWVLANDLHPHGDNFLHFSNWSYTRCTTVYHGISSSVCISNLNWIVKWSTPSGDYHNPSFGLVLVIFTIHGDFQSLIQYEVNTTCDSRLILIFTIFAYSNSRHILNMELFKYHLLK